MTERQRRIFDAFDGLPRAAVMQGSKVSIAGDVSKLVGETVTYEELAEALEVHQRAADIYADFVEFATLLLNDENGISEDAFKSLLAERYEIRTLLFLLHHVDATDGRFYLPEGFPA